ncbi:MAG: peroxide stress protein YaaA [Actinomycetales bacterium]|nr:peroxide stress protein YaaA [Actinomycetales bacterium]
MLVVLPPSETKAEPAPRGAPVDLAALSFPELTPARERVLAAAIATTREPDAPARFFVGPAVADEVARNARLRELPARPALEVYRGVLFDALDAATLSPAPRRRAAAGVVVVSGLWGALRPDDRIPPYRLHVCSRLVGLPALEPLWREVLPDVLARAAGAGVVLDCRSSGHRAMGAPASLADRTVVVRVMRDDGSRRSVGAHDAKRTRGLVVRHLLETGADVGAPDALPDALADRWPAVAVPPARPRQPWALEVVAEPRAA